MLISYILPQHVINNSDLETEFNSPSWTASKIRRKTGISSRHVVTGELVSDLAVAAAERLFEEHSIDRQKVDFLLLCTQSPDFFLPTTACIVQNRLGLPVSTGAFDFNLGCSGAVYGLAVAKGLLCAGVAHNVLLITAESYSHYINQEDHSTRTIFGDGAAAVLLIQDDINTLGRFVLGTDGSGASNLIVPAGAMACPISDKTARVVEDSSGNRRSQENLYMNGPEIFAFTLRTVPSLIAETLKKNDLSADQIDCYVFHQANRFMLETLREKLDIESEKFYIDLEDTGNTVSSTIPIALYRAQKASVIKQGMKVLIAGFGVGYSWGATILQF